MAEKTENPAALVSDLVNARTVLEQAMAGGRIVAGMTMASGVRAVLDILAEAGLILTPGREAALRAEGREEAAAAILEHRAKHFPANDKCNPAQRTFVRHLHVAARVASPPVSLEQVAQVLEAAIRSRHGDGEADRG